MSSRIDIPKDSVHEAVEILVKFSPKIKYYGYQDKINLIVNDVVLYFEAEYPKYKINFNEIDEIYSGEENNFNKCVYEGINHVVADYVFRNLVLNGKYQLIFDADKNLFCILDKNGNITDIGGTSRLDGK